MSKWVCSICSYVYDERKEGVPFKDLPESWVCPLCGAPKSAFRPEQAAGEPESAEKKKPVRKKVQTEGTGTHGMKQLSAGELSAVCSNLARGCEKQYKDREALLFRQLADFFASETPVVPDAGQEELIRLVHRDLEEGYPALRAGAQEAGDRGTQRICVWGEKVTAILDALLARYAREGEGFLTNTDVWVCTVCGFLYVGDTPPALCPVCKVPAWKFEKTEGRGQQ